MYEKMSKNQLIELLIEQERLILRKDRVALLGEEIEDLADRWRKPLIAINASANKLQIKNLLGIMDDKIFKQELNTIMKNSEFLSQSLYDTTTFCIQETTKKVFEVNTILKSVLSISQVMSEQKEIQIIFEPSIECYVKGYENELMQAILNIINNGIDELMKKRGDKFIQIKIKPENDLIFISIEDNAGGIQEELKNEIFKQYFTTKGEDGLGTGLFVTKKIITEHFNGKINVSNTKNGAQFMIQLPSYKFLELHENKKPKENHGK